MSQEPSADNPAPSAFAVLRRFARPRRPAERCDLCSAELGPEHEHLVEPATRQLLCACQPCAILFTSQAAKKYRRVPRRSFFLPDFRLTDGQWEALSLPIHLAFFFHSSTAGKVVAMYPSPAGATESQVPLDAWESLVQENPVLRELEPDVEALLVNRVGPSPEYYRVPIDECYKLVGLIRSHWRGLSGGTEVWKEIGQFFTGLKARSAGRRAAPHA